MKHLAARIAVLLAAGSLCGLAGPALAARLKVGSPAPEIVAKALDGQTLDLAALKGHVVVVNIWATWCAPCRAEMPMLDAFYRRYRSQGLNLIGFSADRTRDRKEVARVMSAFSYPSGLLADAKPNEVGEPRSLPMTFVIDKAGSVRQVFGPDGGTLTEEKLAGAVLPLL
jgi:thiol-disulfide isomerase/thioredoxin